MLRGAFPEEDPEGAPPSPGSGTSPEDDVQMSSGVISSEGSGGMRATSEDPAQAGRAAASAEPVWGAGPTPARAPERWAPPTPWRLPDALSEAPKPAHSPT